MQAPGQRPLPVAKSVELLNHVVGFAGWCSRIVKVRHRLVCARSTFG
jgi:hypothetical protein